MHAGRPGTGRDPDFYLVVASPDAPLFQPSGPRYRCPHDCLDNLNGGSFWTVNNHWDTNFPVRIFDPAPFRLLLSLTDARHAHAELCAMTVPHVTVRTPYLDEATEVPNW